MKSLFSPRSDIGCILCLGAHSDDIEIGCGGSILQLLAKRPSTRVEWVVMSGSADRAEEARRSAERFLMNCEDARVHVAQFRDGYFPYSALLKEYFEDLKRGCDPDLIFTHARTDRHQDHRTVSDLTWNTFRDHVILEYEIPKYDGDIGQPNLFMPIDEETRQKKVETLLEVFASQRSHNWFARSTFDALMRLRGMECNSASGYAEAFHARKLVVDR